MYLSGVQDGRMTREKNSGAKEPINDFEI